MTLEAKIFKAYLWGNMKDGFDNNEEYSIGIEQISSVASKSELKRIARNYFEGRMLARTENRSLPMTRAKINVEWQSGSLDELPMTYEVQYDGTYIGRIDVE